jgi:hypothetical protein
MKLVTLQGGQTRHPEPIRSSARINHAGPVQLGPDVTANANGRTGERFDRSGEAARRSFRRVLPTRPATSASTEEGKAGWVGRSGRGSWLQAWTIIGPDEPVIYPNAAEGST